MKTAVSDLAMFGGEPAFSSPLHVGRPNLGSPERLIERLREILDRRWLTNNGSFVQELERRIAEHVGVKHCIAMCNGTVALEIVSRAVGLDGEVIVPSFTFIATAHALKWQEITPVFCDIDPRTHTIDPDAIERLITPATTGIIGVHTWGRPCAIDALREIASRRGLRLIFDAAHAFSCSYGDRMIGSFGDAEVMSFHATKFFNTFEGGAVTTDDDEIARKVRLMQNFGFAGPDNVVYIGTNGKMNEFSAAAGLTSLERLDDFIDCNRRNFACYSRELSEIKGIQLLQYDGRNRSNFQYIVCEIDHPQITRDEVVRILQAEGVLARRYFYPGCHRMEPYRSYFPNARLLLPETEGLCERVLVLPTGTSVGESDIREICGLLHFVFENPETVRRHLDAH